MQLRRAPQVLTHRWRPVQNPQASRFLRRYVEIADSLREIAARPDSSRLGLTSPKALTMTAILAYGVGLGLTPW